MFQPLRLLMHFVPGVLQDDVKEQFKKPVMAHKLSGAAFSRRRQPNTPVLLIRDESWALRGKPLTHTGHRGRPYPQPLGEGLRCDRQLIGAAQFEDRLQIVVHRFRNRKHSSVRRHYL